MDATLVVEGSQLLLERLRLLREDPAALQRIGVGVQERGYADGGDVVLQQWEVLILRTFWQRAHASMVTYRRARSVSSMSSHILSAASRRLHMHLAHRFVERQPLRAKRRLAP